MAATENRQAQELRDEPAKRRDGWLGLFIFYVFCLILFGVPLWLKLEPEWRVNQFYLESRCVVLDKRLVERQRWKGGPAYRPELLIRYAVDGKDYEVWARYAVDADDQWQAWNQRLLDGFVIGTEYPCWHNPEAPSEAVLYRGFSWLTCGLMVAVLVPIVLAGRTIVMRLRGD